MGGVHQRKKYVACLAALANTPQKKNVVQRVAKMVTGNWYLHRNLQLRYPFLCYFVCYGFLYVESFFATLLFHKAIFQPDVGLPWFARVVNRQASCLQLFVCMRIAFHLQKRELFHLPSDFLHCTYIGQKKSEI